MNVMWTLYHRAQMATSNWNDKYEKEHVGDSLIKCGYLAWTLQDVGSGAAREAQGLSSKQKFQGRVTIP